MRALTDGYVGWFGFRFLHCRIHGNISGVGILFYLGNLIMEVLRLDFGIWAGILLFRDVAPMRALAEGDFGRFGI